MKFMGKYFCFLLLLFVMVGCKPDVPKLEGTSKPDVPKLEGTSKPDVPKLEGTTWVSEDGKETLSFKTATVVAWNGNYNWDYKIEGKIVTIGNAFTRKLLTYNDGKLEGSLYVNKYYENEGNVVLTMQSKNDVQTVKSNARLKATAVEQDPRIKRCEEWVMGDLNSCFLRSGGDLYTTQFGEGGDTVYIQLKKPVVKSESIALSDADKLNNIAWQANYNIKASGYRVASSDSGSFRWSDWMFFSGEVGEQYIIWRFVEIDGKLKLKNRYMHFEKGIETVGGSFDDAKKIDVLPESLIDPVAANNPRSTTGAATTTPPAEASQPEASESSNSGFSAPSLQIATAHEVRIKPIPQGESPDGSFEFIMINRTVHPNGKTETTQTLAIRNKKTKNIIDWTGAKNSPLSIFDVAYPLSMDKILWSPGSKCVAVATTETIRGVSNLNFFYVTNDVIKTVFTTGEYSGTPLEWRGENRFLFSNTSGKHLIVFDKASLTFTEKGKADGVGISVGGGQGAGNKSGGNHESDFSWYHSMLHDRFYDPWDQPLAVVQSGQDIATLIKIKIDRAGHVSGVSLAKSSGNSSLDDSALTAAQRVTQVDPLPKGLGDNEGYEVNIEFKLRRNTAPSPDMSSLALEPVDTSAPVPEPKPVEEVGIDAPGNYGKAVGNAIGARWEFYRKTHKDALGVGEVRIEFAIDAQGHPSELHVLSNTAGAVNASFAQRAVKEAHIPPIPPERLAQLPGGRIKITYTFTILGEGAEKNEKGAFELLLKSAEKGIPDAQLALAVCYKNGTDVAVDFVKARGWIEKMSPDTEFYQNNATTIKKIQAELAKTGKK